MTAFPTLSPIAGLGRMPVFTVVAALLPALLFFALSGYALMASRIKYEERAELLSQNLAEALEQGVSAQIDKIDMAVSTTVELLEHRLRGPSRDLKDVELHIRALTTGRSDMEGLRVTDEKGLVILGSVGEPGAPSASYADRDWFQAQREQRAHGLHMSEPLIGKLNGVWMVAFSRRYQTPDGRFAGCVVAAVPLSYFESRLRALNVGPGGFVTLRHASLALVARHTPGVTLADPPGSKRVSESFRSMIESGQVRATYRSRSPIDDDERTNTMRRLSQVPLLVVVGASSQEYLRDWYAERRAVAGLCAVIVLLYLAGGMLMWRVHRQSLQARRRIELLAKVFEHSAESIVVSNRDDQVIEVNPAFVRQSGYQPSEIVGSSAKLMASHRNTPERHLEVRRGMQENGSWCGELWARAKDGREYPVWLSMSELKDEQGEVTHRITSAIDISEQKQVEDRIRHLAHHDTLTQLPNRVLLHASLEQALALARRDGAALALLFVDMDHFKNINDTLGHPVGDGLLVEVGRRLVGLVRASDIVARLGGDEFVVLLTGLSADATAAAASVAAKVLSELGRPYLVRGHALHSTPSIGIGLFPADGLDADTLLKNADTAMYQAKAAGRDNYQFFTEAMNEATVERLALEAGLRVAVQRGEMSLHYQPQLDMKTGRLVGVEALLRWQHPERGWIAPMVFIPVAEDTGQIEALGAWVLDEALAQVARWRRDGHPDLRVAVNLSAKQLRVDSFADEVSRALSRHGLGGEALELELTESLAMRDPAQTAELLRELRCQGVALAIDDFGTGYSSLAYLKRLPLSCLKLDRSFVMDIETDPNDAAICTATIQLAHSLGLGVVAEGVETQAQLDFLRRLGCDTVQGYFISRPLAAQDCRTFLDAARHAEPGLVPA